MGNRRVVAWSAALAVGIAVTSCATLPTSGSVRVGTLQESDAQAQHGVVIVPVPPGRGWSPRYIVLGFLAASAAFDNHDHAVARKYLTPAFNRKWHPGWAATIIDSPNVHTVTPPPPRLPKLNNPAGPSKIVDVTGKRFATLEAPGQDQAGSVVISPGQQRYRFSLVQRPGGWRINGILAGGASLASRLKPAPPTLLMLSSTDFARDYLPRNLYFFPPHGNTLVPDPVYIPQTGPVTEVKGLVNALIHPSLASWLWPAATTAFPYGTKQIRPPQIIGGITAVIDLGGKAAKADKSQRGRMAAQLYWSLTSSPYTTQYASPIRSVVLEINGRQVKSPMATRAAWLAHGQPSPLYYQAPAQGTALAILPLRSSSPVPLPEPSGLGTGAFTTMAVSPSPKQDAPATLAGCAGRNLYLVKLGAGVQEAKKSSASARLTAVRRRLPADCSSLSWDPNGNLWIAATSQALVLRTAGAATLARASLVDVQIPELAAHPPPITALRIAPDGVRIAMIVGRGQGKRILLAAVSRTSSFTSIGETLRVGSDIPDPAALTWLDSYHLLALSKPGTGRAQLYEVPLNGGESTSIPTPRGAASVAANWEGGAALHVVVGIAPTPRAPGEIEISKGGWPSPDWAPVTKGITPTYPG